MKIEKINRGDTNFYFSRALNFSTAYNYSPDLSNGKAMPERKPLRKQKVFCLFTQFNDSWIKAAVQNMFRKRCFVGR